VEELLFVVRQQGRPFEAMAFLSFE